MASSHVMVRGNMLRMAGVYTLNASEWIWSGNTHPDGTLQIVAGATSNIVRDNATTLPITDNGKDNVLAGNVVMKKSGNP